MSDTVVKGAYWKCEECGAHALGSKCPVCGEGKR